MKRANQLYGLPEPSTKERWSKRFFYIFSTIVVLIVLISIVTPPMTPDEELAKAREDYRAAFERSQAHDKREADRRAEEREEWLAERAAKRTARSEANRAATEKRNLGHHCLSSWDGSSRKFVAAVKERMHDPSSFNHDKTLISKNINGSHTVRMTFRGKNGFGGTVRSLATGSLNHATCEPTLTNVAML